MTGKIIQGLDILDIVTIVGKKNKKFQATLLQDVEDIIKDEEEYKLVRKLILDSFNNYTRSVLRLIFGNSFE